MSSHSAASLHDKVILITGAGSGIGRSIALHCANLGASTALADLSLDAANETHSLLAAEQKSHAIAVRADVSVPQDAAQMVQNAIDRFGRLDGVVANAGVFGMPYPALDTPLDAWESALRINLTGTLLTLQQGGRALVRQGRGGSMVVIGSALGVRPIGGNLGYSAAKAAVHMLVRAMAVELAEHRIRVNAIVPGVTVTPATINIPGYLEHVSTQLPLRSPAQPEEVAHLTALVLSEALPHMTGSLLPIDSGVLSA